MKIIRRGVIFHDRLYQKAYTFLLDSSTVCEKSWLSEFTVYKVHIKWKPYYPMGPRERICECQWITLQI